MAEEMMDELFGTSDNESDEEGRNVQQGVDEIMRKHIESPTNSGDEIEAKPRKRRARLESDEEEEDEEMEAGPGSGQRRKSDVAGPSDLEKNLMKATGLESSDDEEEEDAGLHQRSTEKDILRQTGLESEDEIEETSEKEDRGPRKPEKVYGPPLHLQVPLKPPPGKAENLVVLRSSNILTVEPKRFDPDTFDEDEVYLDEKGLKRVRLDDNIARWREVLDADGNVKRESNARFVKWSDGTWQLMIGTEVLNMQKQSMAGDQAQLFVKHPRGLLQGQGKLVWKMRLMPSSLDSKSHRKLTQLVDSKHKKVYKVKTVATTVDPEKEKLAREKAEQDRVEASENLARRQDRHMRKFAGEYDTYSRDRDAPRALNPDYLEELEESDDEDGGGRADRRRRDFEERMAREEEAEQRIIRAKRESRPAAREPPRKKSRGGRELETDSEEEEEEEDIFSEEEDKYEDSEEEAKEQKKRAKQRAKEVEEPPARKSTGKKAGGRRVVMTDSDEDD
ncbi:Leo1-like protein [Klebsormidium nitens]|uniref:Leo1-like protein n=1 Tax=Klebsormidium nitens TaxID=105231 RepID=A0A1Y1I417_KLENI|nr:Leo1-like protein [Klebsormidium nitens]|eukprot:GAQ82848.1 Leo1-like protein [Klebsormidium nitens]